MPRILSVSTCEFPFKSGQNELKRFSKEMFGPEYEDINRLLDSYDNAEITERNLCVPIEFFKEKKSFSERNNLYIKNVLKYSVEVINDALSKSGIGKDKITDIVFVSSTGISTPSIDALLINEMKLNPYINRIPVWGLGCAGGVSGLSKVFVIAKANPDAVILLLAAELCSLTFIKNDLSKSNLIAAGLFSDGISAVITAGRNISSQSCRHEIEIINSQSRLYYNSLNVMGWDIIDSGFKVIFSRDIPSIVNSKIKEDIDAFLHKNNLRLPYIKNFIVHPGGKKVIEAYEKALGINPVRFANTRKVLRENGNMSSATVLYVLNEFIDGGFENGYGLMMSLGPGFSSEMLLLKMKNEQS